MSKKNSSIDDAVKVTAIVVICGLIGAGVYFGLTSLYYILPIITVLIAIVVAVNNMKSEKKIKIEEAISGIIAIAIVVTIIVALGSCFHNDKDRVRDVRMERVNMGLPMY